MNQLREEKKNPNPQPSREELKKQIRQILMTDFYHKDWIDAGEKTVDKLTNLLTTSDVEAVKAEIKFLERLKLEFDANITKREMPDGYVTLVQNYQAPDDEPEKDEETIEIEGQKYTVSEIKKALEKGKG